MVILRITKSELEQLILWGSEYLNTAKDCRVPFEPEETRLLEWLREKRKKEG
jgi:hypothetical protein